MKVKLLKTILLLQFLCIGFLPAFPMCKAKPQKDCDPLCICENWGCEPDRIKHRICWVCKKHGCDLPIPIKEASIFVNWEDNAVFGSDAPAEGLYYEIWVNSESTLIDNGTLDAFALLNVWLLPAYADIYIKIFDPDNMVLPKYQGAVIMDATPQEVEITPNTHIDSYVYYSHDLSDAVGLEFEILHNTVSVANVTTDGSGQLILSNLIRGNYSIKLDGSEVASFFGTGFNTFSDDIEVTIEGSIDSILRKVSKSRNFLFSYNNRVILL
jgi:hypothetical protein